MGHIGKIIAERRAPGVVGTARRSGGHGRRQMHFNQPDPGFDIPETLRKMEEAGKFRGRPDLMAAAKAKLQEAQSMAPQHLDYGNKDDPIASWPGSQPEFKVTEADLRYSDDD